LMFYNKIVEQRNAALKKWGENDPKHAEKAVYTEGSPQLNWQQLIETYDSQLLPSANYIFEKRRAFITDFEPIFNYFYKKITDERETVSIVYESQLLTDSFTNLLHRHREKDRYLQRTSAGIHKDNLSFEMNGKPIRKFGSQGQLKSFVIALKLAQYHVLRIKHEKLDIHSDDESDAQKGELTGHSDLILKNNLDHNSSLELEDRLENTLNIEGELATKDELKTAAHLDLNDELNTHFELELRTQSELKNESESADKSLINSLKIADKPLLLLDDIFDKLDENRVQNLLQLIVSQQFGQIFITDTHIERIEKLGADLGIHFKKFEIENGVIGTD
jgi:recombinational DNA repair ATPase RecF